MTDKTSTVPAAAETYVTTVSFQQLNKKWLCIYYFFYY